MDDGIDSGEDENFSWSDEELETDDNASPSCTSARDDIVESGTTGSACSKLISNFIGMGFSKDMIARAIKENGEADANALLETLLTYSAIEKSPEGCQQAISSLSSSESERSTEDDEISDFHGFTTSEDSAEVLSEKDKKWMQLVEMGFTEVEATAAIDRCGPKVDLIELQDFIYAAQVAKEADAHLEKQSQSGSNEYEESLGHLCESSRNKKKRKRPEQEIWGRGPVSQRKKERGRRPYFNPSHDEFEHDEVDKDEPSSLSLPHLMMGFGVPDMPAIRTQRRIPDAAVGPPYFYYENVALAPKGVWETISRFLYDIEPEFVDSKYFSATARKRGYIHNLPINNRFPLEPRPPHTIFEALPLTRKWWPSWDPRTQLNCLQTCMASNSVTERIRTALSCSPDPPPQDVQKYVLGQCRKWNLVWVGVHKAAPLEPDEMEMLLGFPRNHTRGGGVSRNERFKALGNSFQVDTVAYHFSVLKDLFPDGIIVLSLFSGIGGAEVALHRLGVRLKAVVSVELSETCRNIFRSWWEQTNQTGILIDMVDVRELDTTRLKQLMNEVGGFDLVVGGSPCNNLSGGNRVTRDGLEGEHSSLFYDYFRILDLVKGIAEKRI